MCRESTKAPTRLTGIAHYKEASVPPVKLCGSESVTARVLPEWSKLEVSLIQKCRKREKTVTFLRY